MAAGEATFKSNVLLREEKGFAGIPFKRIMLGFMAGALAYMFTRFMVGSWSVFLGVGCGVLAIILTAPGGGISLWQRLLYRLRGRLIMAQIHAPASALASLGKFLELHTEALVIVGEDLFKLPEDDKAEQVDWSEWQTFTEVSQAMRGEGVQLVDGPQAPRLPTGEKAGATP